MRLIAMGSHALMDGFALLGFEVFPNVTTDTVEKVLAQLLKNKEKALVFLENNLSQQPGKYLSQARSEAAGIIITEIPPLHAPDAYRPLVEELVTRVLGTTALD